MSAPSPEGRQQTARGAWRSPSVAVVAAVQVAVVAVAASGLLLAPGPAEGPGGSSWSSWSSWSDQVIFDLTAAVGYSVLGALVLRRRPGHRVGLVMLVIGALAGAGVLARGWQGWLPAAWAEQWLWWPALALTPVAVLLFPEGRLPSRRWRVVLGVLLAGAVLGTAALAAAALWYPRTLTSDPSLEVGGTPSALVRVAAVAVALWAAGVIAVCASLVVRLVSADGVVRRQVLCLLAGATVLVLLLALDAAAAMLDLASLPLLTVAQAATLPVALTAAGLRYRLYDLDVLLNRTVVWTVMSAAVLLAYVVGVALAASVVAGERGRVVATLVVTAAAAVGFEPLRRVVQRAVDRSLFGRRGEPYAVLRDLSRHLAEAVDPGETLPRLVTSVAGSLRVPYVAVEVEDRLVASAGRPATSTETFPLRARGQDIGRLLVSTRREGEPLTRSERRLLRDLAEQANGAVEAWLLTLDLRRSRERLVAAREEERRRLRADLHDGFGPALLGSAMQLDAAGRLLPAGSPAGRLVLQVSGDLRECRAELRGLVEGLRPASLDEGLGAAVRAESVRTVGDRLSLEVSCPDDLGPLPAAVEVAALRIAGEAVANVVRHSGATTCRVRLARGRDLELVVDDDGHGLTGDGGSPDGGGVGLVSARARTEEVGGSFHLESGPAGTTLRARLPLPSTEARPETTGTDALADGTPDALSSVAQHLNDSRAGVPGR